MASIVGFTLASGVGPAGLARAAAAQRVALRHFPALAGESLTIGGTTLDVWGRPGFQGRIARAPEGTVFALVGSPQGPIDWARDGAALFSGRDACTAGLPWDGRVVVVKVSDGGARWDMWTDWVGSIPVYHAKADRGWIASTIEPVVVAAAGFSDRDISLQGLVGLLVDGHFLNDSTLLAGMRVVPADAHAAWFQGRFTCRDLKSVLPGRERWEADWDALVDEMHDLVRGAITAALRQHSSWLLPLSSGLDSRLIAAVGSDMGADLRAYSWGSPDSTDVVWGRRVARRLGLPWRHIDLGADYLLTQTGPWTDVFGSSMHVHGMYQMAFFEGLLHEPACPVVSGFLGDSLAGVNNQALLDAHSDAGGGQLHPDAYVHWTAEAAAGLLQVPAADALAAIREQIAATLRSLPGAGFQQATLLNIRNRQRRFTGFSACLGDYARGVAAPYLSRAYARFCLSLPKAALERRLLADVFRRYYPTLAALPGSYAPEPYLRTGRYLLARRIASSVPFASARARRTYVPLTMDLACVRKHGWQALWPLRERRDRLRDWVDLDQVTRVAEDVFAGRTGMKGVRKLQSVQCLAHRLQPAHPATEGVQ